MIDFLFPDYVYPKTKYAVDIDRIPLLDRSKETTSLNNLSVIVGKVPANNCASLAAANDSPGIKLQFENPCHVCSDMVV